MLAVAGSKIAEIIIMKMMQRRQWNKCQQKNFIMRH
jgi:hypothetical protein